jgi:hypothetical protein
MITSKYKAGETVPAFDAQVTEGLDDYGIAGGGNEMRIAVENFDGKVYRIVTTVGLGAYMHATSRLLELGLKDLLADSLKGKDGFDSWFVTTPETLSEPPAEVPATDAATEVLAFAEAMKDLPETERQALILSRVGQGAFRQAVVAHWQACAVTGASCIPLLRASHIKPWRDATNAERLDPSNGLLLSPSLDAAFDAGYITFDGGGRIVLSGAIAGQPAFQLYITPKLRINSKLLTPGHLPYLQHHRDKVFLGT